DGIRVFHVTEFRRVLLPISGRLEIEGSTEFTGYDRLTDRGSIIALYREGNPVEALQAGQEGTVILDRTPFYAESGGQVGDKGLLVGQDSAFEVRDTQKQGGGIHAHIGRVKLGELRVGGQVEARVDATARQATVLNHSATHLLHAALRKVLGSHVTQKGSLVEPERLRFDFSHFEPMTREQLEEVERLVNDQIRANADAEAQVM